MIQQRGLVPFTRGLDVIQQSVPGQGKTTAFCAGILNNLDMQKLECQASLRKGRGGWVST
jgi:translation initiation factor 4A